MIDGYGIAAAELSALGRKFDALRKDVFPEASRLAINDVAFKVMYANRDLMKEVFDDPSPFTLRAFYVQKATRDTMTATIQRKTMLSRRHYLEVQSEGGPRPNTGLEKLLMSRLKYEGIIQAVVPTKHARRDRRGNVSRGQINQILSGIQAQRDVTSNTTKDSRKRNRNRAAYFVPNEDSALSPGVYQRKGTNILKVLAFTDKTPRYDDVFPMEEHAAGVAEAEIEPAFDRAFRTALSRV